MPPTSRRAVCRLLLAAPACGRVTPSFAADWPSRGITILVGVAPGGTADLAARVIAQELQPALPGNRPVVVENRAGAATQIATEALVRAPADGHTLLVAGAPFAVNPALFPRLPYDSVRDIAPLTLLVRNGLLLLVPAASPARDAAGLLALARQRGGLNLASAGSGSMTHLAIELLAERTGTNLVHVPYRGSGPALPDLISGQVDAMFDNPSSALPLLREGRLRALAYTGEARFPSLPEVPALAETPGLAGFSAENWFGLFARAGTPEPVLERLHAAVTAILRRPEVVARFRQDGSEAAPMSRAAFRDFVLAEMVRWGEVVKARGITPG
ncbi:tripartite tricarboxylate transporter substrate binding protein [Roseomonas sp. NAR14]|uniref:Tripartite tricarboxylate transporter substrate binding protein n=1 Tax=Roseomonas acroporae TaxID=2937791 RepID=A0A9X1YCM7_9PROT|nr:tripartite tricarboxylate transporter substrate binding protein [Roseomonas acroporae]MCK8787327.1 tripartite tricarboxylate transporter substrate binding protein [Roseomonas acroporae]